MDEKQLSRHLHDIANEEVSDVELWNRINNQLETQPTARRIRPALPALRWIAAITVVLFVSLSGYAAYQQFVGSVDPSLPQEQITVLNLEQTVNGITATLDRAYVDEFRASIFHVITYENDTQTLGSITHMELRTADGIVIPPEFGRGGGGGGNSETRTISDQTNFDMSVLDTIPQTIDLVYTVTYGGSETPARAAPQSDSGGGGGGGGGGTSPQQADQVAPERTFTFEFSLPVIEALSLDQTREASDRGITFSAENVRIAPSMTKFDLCHTGLVTDEFADLEGNQVIMVQIGDVQQRAGILAERTPDGYTAPGCYKAHALLPYENEPDTLTIEPQFLQPVPITEASAEAIEADFARMGIALTIDIFETDSDDPQAHPGYGIEIDRSQSPLLDDPNRTVQDLNQRVMNYRFFSEKLDTDWTMTFNLP